MSSRLLGTSLLLHALEPLANGVLNLDPIAHARMAALAGRRLRLRTSDAEHTAITLAFAADHFTLHAGDELPVDLELRGNPFALLRALRNGDVENVDNDTRHGRDPILCTGDTRLLADVASILRDLSPDLLAPLRAIAGNDIASALHTGGAVARAAAEQLIGQLRGRAPSLGSATNLSANVSSNVNALLQKIGAALRKVRPGE